MKQVSYPVYLRLVGRRVLVVGAGTVATRKIERLVEAGAQVHVVAPHASVQVHALAEAGRLELTLRAAQPEDVAGARLVLCATDSLEVNARLAAAARAARALVARVDAPDESDFTVPAVVRTASIEAAIATHGQAPSASLRIAHELRAWLTAGPERFAREIATLRTRLRGRSDARSRLCSVSQGPLFAACAAADEAKITQILAAAAPETPPARAPECAQTVLHTREVAP